MHRIKLDGRTVLFVDGDVPACLRCKHGKDLTISNNTVALKCHAVTESAGVVELKFCTEDGFMRTTNGVEIPKDGCRHFKKSVPMKTPPCCEYKVPVKYGSGGKIPPRESANILNVDFAEMEARMLEKLGTLPLNVGSLYDLSGDLVFDFGDLVAKTRESPLTPDEAASKHTDKSKSTKDSFYGRQIPTDLLEFATELETLINRHNIERFSGTPDFILAEYLIGCLDNINKFSAFRDNYYDFTKPYQK